MRIAAVLLSCEHGGNRVPAAYGRLFESAAARAALASHRGLDLGALTMAEALARRLDIELHAATVTRLLVELNKSPHHRALFSEFSADLEAAAREQILERYYRPHRQRIIEAIAGKRGLVCHIGVHSFTPALNGVERKADIGFLYDPRRARERELCGRWQDILERLDPALRVRRNYPYLGKADGLTTALRRHFPPERYLGIELETNQALLTGSSSTRRRITDRVATSLEELVRIYRT